MSCICLSIFITRTSLLLVFGTGFIGGLVVECCHFVLFPQSFLILVFAFISSLLLKKYLELLIFIYFCKYDFNLHEQHIYHSLMSRFFLVLLCLSSYSDQASTINSPVNHFGWKLGLSNHIYI